jgi:hypothetical protein
VTTLKLSCDAALEAKTKKVKEEVREEVLGDLLMDLRYGCLAEVIEEIIKGKGASAYASLMFRHQHGLKGACPVPEDG